MLNQQNELDKLIDYFDNIEKQSRIEDTFDEDCFLVIRLDGFHHSKNHLKNVLINPDYNIRLHKSIVHTYNSFRRHLCKESESSFMCACSFNDEVSFVLLNNCTNFDRRIMKYCTLFSGVMSSAMTGYQIQCSSSQESSRIHFDAFDARPLILKNKDDIIKYIMLRLFLADRQAYWKVLRRADYPEWHTDRIKGNIDICRSLVLENHFENDYQIIRRTFRLYEPDKLHNLNFSSFDSK